MSSTSVQHVVNQDTSSNNSTELVNLEEMEIESDEEDLNKYVLAYDGYDSAFRGKFVGRTYIPGQSRPEKRRRRTGPPRKTAEIRFIQHTPDRGRVFTRFMNLTKEVLEVHQKDGKFYITNIDSGDEEVDDEEETPPASGSAEGASVSIDPSSCSTEPTIGSNEGASVSIDPSTCLTKPPSASSSAAQASTSGSAEPVKGSIDPSSGPAELAAGSAVGASGSIDAASFSAAQASTSGSAEPEKGSMDPSSGPAAQASTSGSAEREKGGELMLRHLKHLVYKTGKLEDSTDAIANYLQDNDPTLLKIVLKDKQTTFVKLKKHLQELLNKRKENDELRAQILKEKRDEIKKVKAAMKRTINEIKKKQWCIVCGKEASCFCCWNSSYCTPKCQTKHWKTHKNFCERVTGKLGRVTKEPPIHNRRQLPFLAPKRFPR